MSEQFDTMSDGSPRMPDFTQAEWKRERTRMSEKKHDVKLTISRPTNGDGSRCINIAIVDCASGCEFFSGQIECADFAEALTGLAFQPMKAVLRLANVGKSREIKIEVIEWDRWKKDSVSAQDAVRPYEVDGWRAHLDDLGNGHRRAKGPNVNRWNVTFVRFV